MGMSHDEKEQAFRELMPLGLQRAYEINLACVQVALAGGGLTPEKIAEVRSFGLDEMLGAAHAIERFEIEMKKHPNVYVPITITCDDRLLAAMYTLLHWDAGYEPIARIDGKKLLIAKA